jgi:hypothetical protein
MDTDTEKAMRATIGATSDNTSPRIAQDYVHTIHPDTGIEVVFVPGEALPAWARVGADSIDDTAFRLLVNE